MESANWGGSVGRVRVAEPLLKVLRLCKMVFVARRKSSENRLLHAAVARRELCTYSREGVLVMPLLLCCNGLICVWGCFVQRFCG